jgi:hypothetical protein
MLDVKDNNAYTEKEDANHLATTWQPNGNHLATQYSIDKYREEEISIEKDSIEKESVEEKKPARETTHTLFERLIPDYALSDSLKDKMKVWITYKTERREPYKEQGLKSLLRQVENNAAKYGDMALCDLIDKCMASNWKGIIFDKLEQNQSKAPYSRQSKEETIQNRVSVVDSW